MTNIDGERKEFEAWYAGEYLNASSPIFRDAQFAKNGNDTYHSAEIRKSWNGWLARAQVERGIPVAKLETLCDEWSQGDRLGCSPAYHEGLLDASIELRELLPRPPKEDGE